ncbi:MAG: peptidoglycan DD-metalloendopeptidase family protein [Bacteroidales bacterium]|jgi:murein DD-endopeptidase MepM/ murein hydrolase activator NlpD|nr:peptidoglycan DD-metalloendopeptidase family protein [Bacteroidales bacterium]
MVTKLKPVQHILIAAGSLFIIVNTASSQVITNKHTSAHKNLLATQDDIKKEIALVDSLILSYYQQSEENPAEDLYGDEWDSKRVDPYSGKEIELPNSLVIDCSTFSMPVNKTYITSNFGSRGRRFHYGTDLKLEVGDTVYAAFSGKVRVCNYEARGYGYYVILRHHNGFETIYGHLSDFLVTEGNEIEVGQPIALGGNTGRSTGPHLHFEVRILGKAINPVDVFDFENEVTHVDNYVFSPQKLAQERKIAEKYTQKRVSYYKVRKGDTINTIARKYGITVSRLCKLNNISSKKTLQIGQRLRCS